MIQAIVGMWRKVGIEAEIEVYEIAKHYELRAADQLAPAAFYNWGNSIGDPSTSTGFAMFGPSPHSVWDGQDVIDMIGPLWGEPDEAKRIDGYKAVDKHIAEEGEVIPLLQYVQPIVFADTVDGDAARLRRRAAVPDEAGGVARASLPSSSPGLPRSGKPSPMTPDVPNAPTFRDMACPDQVRAVTLRSASGMTAGCGGQRHDRAPRHPDPLVTTLITLFGVAVIVFVVDPRRARRSDRHDAAARRDRGRHRAPARPLRPRPLDPRAVLHLARQRRCTATSARRSRSARTCSAIVLNRLPATLELSLARARSSPSSLGAALAFVATRWRETPAETGVDVANGVALSVPDFLWGLALILALGVAWPVLRDLRPRRAAPRPPVRHAVLPDREPAAAPLRHHRRPPRPHADAGAGAGAAARRGHRAAPEVLAEGGDEPGLRDAGAHQGLFREPRHPARRAAQRPAADADADRRAAHLPDRRHGDHRAHLLLRGPRQSRDRRGDQPRPAADPGHRARSSRCSSSASTSPSISLYALLNPRLRHG